MSAKRHIELTRQTEARISEQCRASKRAMLTQSWIYVGPGSHTVSEHQINIRAISYVWACRDAPQRKQKYLYSAMQNQKSVSAYVLALHGNIAEWFKQCLGNGERFIWKTFSGLLLLLLMFIACDRICFWLEYTPTAALEAPASCPRAVFIGRDYSRLPLAWETKSYVNSRRRMLAVVISSQMAESIYPRITHAE